MATTPGSAVWVRFLQDYDYRATQGVTVAYKAGMTQNVTARCATLAVAAGKAVRLKTPRKSEEPAAELDIQPDAD